MKKPICFVAPVASSVSVQGSTPPSVARSRLAYRLFQQTVNFLVIFSKSRFFLWNIIIVFGIISTSVSSALETVPYDAKSKRDPFVPLVTTSTKPSSGGLISVESIDEISIEGIVYDPKGESMVIVNGTMLKEGEEQGSVKVLKIDAGGAKFSVNSVEGYKPQHQTDTN